MSCNRCADQATAAMTTAGVPARQSQAAWAVGGSHPHCPACGAFLTRRGGCVSPRCALRRLLDCPALKSDDLEPGNDAVIGAAHATLARLDEQAMQSLQYLLECPALLRAARASDTRLTSAYAESFTD